MAQVKSIVDDYPHWQAHHLTVNKRLQPGSIIYEQCLPAGKVTEATILSAVYPTMRACNTNTDLVHYQIEHEGFVLHTEDREVFYRLLILHGSFMIRGMQHIATHRGAIPKQPATSAIATTKKDATACSAGQLEERLNELATDICTQYEWEHREGDNIEAALALAYANAIRNIRSHTTGVPEAANTLFPVPLHCSPFSASSPYERGAVQAQATCKEEILNLSEAWEWKMLKLLHLDSFPPGWTHHDRLAMAKVVFGKDAPRFLTHSEMMAPYDEHCN